MNKAIFITVRTNSKRLPQKCLLEIDGVRTIEFLIDRLKRSKLADIIVLCTTMNPEDDILCEIAQNKGILHFRGSEKDKHLGHSHSSTSKCLPVTFDPILITNSSSRDEN